MLRDSLLEGFAVGELTGPDTVRTALSEFQAIENRALRTGLALLPWLTIAVGIIVLIGDPHGFDIMLATGLAAAALALLGFQYLMQLIPQTFHSIWSRRIVGLGSPQVPHGPGETRGPQVPATDPSGSQSLEMRYLAFIQDFQRALNHPVGQWAMGAFLAVLGWVIWYEQFGGGPALVLELFLRPSSPQLPIDAWRYRVGFFAEPLLGLIIGLVAWRMIIVGLYIWQFGRRFDLTPQLGHPDGSGGLAPLGNLCLWNALIITIPALHLGGWIIAAPSFPQYAHWPPLLIRLLPVPMAGAAISFFLPLWSVHRIMLAKRAEIQRQLDQLGQSINHLARELLEGAGHLDEDEGEKKAKRLEVFRRIYQQYQNIPVWPINARILRRFIGSQIIPLLGLTGLGEPLVDILRAFISLLAGQSS